MIYIKSSFFFLATTRVHSKIMFRKIYVNEILHPCSLQSCDTHRIQARLLHFFCNGETDIGDADEHDQESWVFDGFSSSLWTDDDSGHSNVFTMNKIWHLWPDRQAQTEPKWQKNNNNCVNIRCCDVFISEYHSSLSLSHRTYVMIITSLMRSVKT